MLVHLQRKYFPTVVPRDDEIDDYEEKDPTNQAAAAAALVCVLCRPEERGASAVQRDDRR